MKAFSKVPMGEVTRLVRAGKLAEAMTLLKGGRAAAASQPGTDSPQATVEIKRPLRLIDTTSDPAPTPSRAARSAALPDVAPALRVLGDRLARPDLLHGMGKGLMRPPAAPLPLGARFEERTFTSPVGSRTYKVYVPSRFRGQAMPVVVMLHGCTQDPDDFAAGTRMNEVAEEQRFLVAYPRQPRSAHMLKCWNWFKSEDQQRDGGEPALIAGIAREVVEEFSADPTRVYVAGLSAGGAAAAVMAATYPDLFAAVGVHSGLACGAASDMPSAVAAMNAGGAVPPRCAGPIVPTIVFHGDADKTVNPVNSDHVVAQARQEARLAEAVTNGEAPSGGTYTRKVQFDAAGEAVLEQWILHGAGHAWSGGGANGSYADPRGPDASREMIRFFLGHSLRS